MHSAARPRVFTLILSFVLSGIWVKAGGIEPSPAPGVYVGVVRIAQSSSDDGLRNTAVMKAVARVKSDGSIAILIAAPTSPKTAADVEKNITRFVRDSANGFYMTEQGIPASVVSNGTVLNITYSDPPAELSQVVPFSDHIIGPVYFPYKGASFVFTLRLQQDRL